MNLSKYIMKEITELDKFIEMNPSRFCAFQDRVEAMLNNLPEGGIINVCDVVEEKSYELFVKLVCVYINEHEFYRKFFESRIWFIDEEYNVIQRTHPLHARKKMNLF